MLDLFSKNTVNIIHSFFRWMFVLYIKMSKGTYYQKHRDLILKRAKGYYENGKERLREQAKHEYRELPEEENNLKREYGRTR